MQAWHVPRRRARAGAGARAPTWIAPHGRALGPLHGMPVGHQGHHRHRRHADRERHRAARRAPAAARRRRGRAAARGRRGDPRQDGDHRAARPIAPARRATRTIRRARRAARRRARRRRWRRAWCRWRSARRPMARSIRPAAFCGVYGFKPSHGLIPRTGHPAHCRARSTRRCLRALPRRRRADRRAADRLRRGRPRHPARARRIPLDAVLHRSRRSTPRVAFVKTPSGTAPTTRPREALRRADRSARRRVRRRRLCPIAMADAWAWHKTIMEAEMARQPRPRMGAGARSAVGRRCASRSSAAAKCARSTTRRRLARMPRLRDELDALFAGFDAILTPAAAGTAPPGSTDRRPRVLHAVDPCAACPRQPAAAERRRTACRSACNWSAHAAATLGCYAPRAGWSHRPSLPESR